MGVPRGIGTDGQAAHQTVQNPSQPYFRYYQLPKDESRLLRVHGRGDFPFVKSDRFYLDKRHTHFIYVLITKPHRPIVHCC